MNRENINLSNENTFIHSQTKAINQLTDNKWTILNEVGGDVYIVNWATYEGSQTQKIWAKQLVLYYLGGYTSDDGTLSGRKSTIKGFVNSIRKILLFSSRISAPESLRKWDQNIITQLFRDNINRKLEFAENTANKGLASRGSTQGIFNAINLSFDAYEAGLASDGFTIKFYNQRKDCMKMFGDILKENDVQIDTYFKGGSFGEVKTEVAMLLLAEAIEVIHSDKTKLAIAFCEFQKTEDKLNHTSIYGYTDSDKNKRRVSLNKYILSGRTFTTPKKMHSNSLRTRSRIAKLYSKLNNEIHGDITSPIWNNHGEFTSYPPVSG